MRRTDTGCLLSGQAGFRYRFVLPMLCNANTLPGVVQTLANRAEIFRVHMPVLTLEKQIAVPVA